MIEKNFALIGAAGYIAPHNIRAIKDTGIRPWIKMTLIVAKTLMLAKGPTE